MAILQAVRRVAVKLLPQRLKRAAKSATFRFSKAMSKASGMGRASTLRIRNFDGFEMAYRQGTVDEAVLKESFSHDIFFSGVPEYQPAVADVILDVGAHIGTFAVLAASKVSRGTVHAIEACQDTFDYLCMNTALNRMGNLHVHHLALSNERGVCTLYHDAENWGHSVVHRQSVSSETVESRTLQEFFEENGIARCNFVKFNCEGAEFPILLGSSAETLRRIDMMLVLYHGDLWTDNSKEELMAHLQASGFECVTRNQTESRGWIVAVQRSS
ncbi:MAG: FkbM family methyltransferase [Terracidiphilus sp.]|jgi:FkbM family methyltransferase